MNPILRLSLVWIFTVLAGPLDAGAQLNNQRDKASYAIGLSWGKNIHQQEADLDVRAILQGMKDGMANRPPLITETERTAVMAKLQDELKAKRAVIAERNKAKGDEFLAENCRKPGVVSLPSGLQYKILKTGTGAKPSSEDRILVNYKSMLIDGSEYESSDNKASGPIEFRLTNVISGWKEALSLMPQGSKWQLFVPPSLAYGEKGGNNVQPNATLIFETEIVDLIPTMISMTNGTAQAGGRIFSPPAPRTRDLESGDYGRATRYDDSAQQRIRQLRAQWEQADAEYRYSAAQDAISDPSDVDYSAIQRRAEALSRRTIIEKQLRALGQ